MNADNECCMWDMKDLVFKRVKWGGVYKWAFQNFIKLNLLEFQLIGEKKLVNYFLLKSLQTSDEDNFFFAVALCFQNGLFLAEAINTCGSADIFCDEEQRFVDREILQQGCLHKLWEHGDFWSERVRQGHLGATVVEHEELASKEAIQTPA